MMNRILFGAGVLLVCVSLLGCHKRQSADQGATKLKNPSSLLVKQKTAVPIDIALSTIKWKGTKLMHTGFHEGTVNFKQGELIFSANELIGGSFTVDMKSIYNTDIPLSDPVPRKNITTHLNADFETSQFPIATFSIIRVTKLTDGQLEISGDMTIKGIANTLKVTATEHEHRKRYTAAFTFDRHNWKIGESGSWLEQKVVDADVSVELELILAKNK